jgi:hypothetical protein
MLELELELEPSAGKGSQRDQDGHSVFSTSG